MSAAVSAPILNTLPASQARAVVTDVTRSLPLCTLATPDYEADSDWRALAISIYSGAPDETLEAYRLLYSGDTYSRKKIWETTQIAYGLRELGLLGGDAVGFGVGCGVEPLLYFFARHTQHLFATDLYGFGWPGAQLDMLIHPEKYAPYDYPQDRLTMLQMNAQQLLMPDACVDFVYSISSIEHFGPLRSALNHVQEAARILKPGGVLAFSTEFVLRAGSVASVGDNTSFFNRTTLEWLIFNSGMELIEPLQLSPAQELLDSPATIHLPQWEVHPSERDRLSSLLIDTIFTDVTVFLRKRA
jgi:SAM-dependent methyltransferase